MNRIKHVRPILQMEVSECGAASLAMVLDYYGRYVTLEELRRDCGVSRNGVNAKNIVLAARHHGLNVTPIRAEVEAMKDVSMPAIIHWNMDHFVVLCGFKKNGAVIADPESGKRFVSNIEFSRSFTGIALLMEPSENFEKKKRGFNSSYLLSFIKRFIPSVIFFMFLELGIVFGNTAILFLNSVYIDKVIIGDNVKTLTYIIMMLAISGGISIMTSIVREKMIWRLGNQMNTKINADFITKILRLPLEFFMNRSPGDLTNREISNLEMGERIAASFFPIPAYFLQVIAYLLFMTAVNSHIAMIAAAFGVLNIVVSLVISNLFEKASEIYTRDVSKMQSDVSRSIDMIETIKSFGAEKAMFSHLVMRGTAVLNSRVKSNRISIFTEGFNNFINKLSTGVILFFGVYEIISGDLSTGTLISMQAIAAAVLQPMDNAIRARMISNTIVSSMARTDDVMRYEDDNKFLPNNKRQTGDIKGDIELKNVSFRFSNVEEPVVKDISISIKRGSSIAITGESGSGKSMVARLIAGIYAPTEGEITYNGLKTQDLKRMYFYSTVASVSQHVRLFSGTVMENITMWNDHITYEEVVDAAQAACIHEEILKRPKTYREEVKENGKNFSGGQRQRIELARALVKNPSILILDEATSALDADTEARVIENIKALGITVIIIAHRLSTIIDCDEIIVMEKGTVSEKGTHSELMKNRSTYYNLIRSND